MSKKIVVILSVVIVIIIIGIVVFNFLQREKTVPEESALEEESSEELTEPVKEVFSLSATVLSVDTAKHHLIVKPKNQETEIKLILDEETKIKKYSVPSDIESASEQGNSYLLTETNIDISDIREGDKLFVKTSINISNKTEIDGVRLIQVLP